MTAVRRNIGQRLHFCGPIVFEHATSPRAGKPIMAVLGVLMKTEARESCDTLPGTIKGRPQRAT